MLTAGRKTFFGLVCIAIAALLLLVVAFKTGQVSDSNFKVFTDFLVWTFGIFATGNAAEHGFKAWGGPDAPAAPVADAPKPA